MAVDYNDERFAKVEADKEAALSEVEKTYGGMIDESESYYKAQIDASKEWAETQKKNQQAQTDFAIEKINQQKDQAKKDYTKEQSGAYVDYQKASGAYGAEAEQQAANGMAGTGFAESTQTAKYVAYQNRVAVARESYNRAVLNYDNAIKDATLQNNSALAEIAYKALQEQLTLSLQGFQYKNSLVLEKANKKRETENTYYGRWRDVLSQINQENALAEEVRQFNAQMEEEMRQFNVQMAEEKRQFDILHSATITGGGDTGGDSGGDSGNKQSDTKDNKETIKDSGDIKETNKDTTKEKDSSPTVDMKSVLNLGYGPISASTLDKLIREGKVIEYEQGGKLKYKKVVSLPSPGKTTNTNTVIKNQKANTQFKNTLKYRG